MEAQRYRGHAHGREDQSLAIDRRLAGCRVGHVGVEPQGSLCLCRRSMMRAIPIRGTDGKIVDFVDPRALPEDAPAEVANAPMDDAPMDAADADPPVRRTRALRSGERRPLSDLLGGSPTTPHPQRSFTTGLVVGL